MQIKSIEPTPSPNTMKLILSEELPLGERNNYSKDNKENAPLELKKLLEIEGVKNVFHVADFIALDRNPKVDWQIILPQARAVFGEQTKNQNDSSVKVDDHFGEVKVQVQMFKGIPMQIKVTDGEEEVRKGLPARFTDAVMKVQVESTNMVLDRNWKEYRARFGNLEKVAEEVTEEIEASFDEERLRFIVESILSAGEMEKPQNKKGKKLTLSMLDEKDWKKRYAALEQLNPSKDDIRVLAKAINDEKSSIRRLAVVYLGMIEDQDVLPYIHKAVLEDTSVSVRRTAGDCVSDMGSETSIPVMIRALQDKNKLVRWRAAMFLYEKGDETAIPALEKASNDNEFEVAMQAKMAHKRIAGGKEAEGSVWKQMTEAMKKKEK